MSESSKKKTDKGAHPVDKTTLTLRHLMLDQSTDKYRLVPLAVRWAHEIRQRDQSTVPFPELVNQALKEILTEKVSLDEIEKLPPPPKVESKAPLAALPSVETPEKKEAEEKEEKPKKSKE